MMETLHPYLLQVFSWLLFNLLTFYAFREPLKAATLCLVTAGISLAPLTSHEKTLLVPLGGFTLDGIRLLSMVIGLGAACLYRRHVPRAAHEWLYTGFLLLAAFSLPFSKDPVLGFSLWLKLLFPFLLLLVLTRENWGHASQAFEEQHRRLYRAGTLALLATLLCVVVSDAAFVRTDVSRLRAMSYGPAHLGAFLAFFCLFVWSNRLESGGQGLLAVFAASLFVITLTVSRASLLTLAAGLSALGFLKRRWMTSLLAPIAVISILLWHPKYIQRNTFLIDSFGPGPSVQPDPSLSALERLESLAAPKHLNSITRGRTKLYQVMAQHSLDYPLLGAGLGSSVHLLTSNHFTGQTPHNEYLRILYETGVPAFVLLLGAYASLALSLYRARPILPPRTRRWNDLALASLVTYAVSALFENTFDMHISVTPWLWGILAYAWRLSRGATEERAPLPRLSKDWPVVGAAKVERVLS